MKTKIISRSIILSLILVFLFITSTGAYYYGKKEGSGSTKEMMTPVPIAEPSILPIETTAFEAAPTIIVSPSPIPKEKELTQSQQELISSIDKRLPEIEKEIAGKKAIRQEIADTVSESIAKNCTEGNPCINPTAYYSVTATLKEIDLDIKTLEAEKNMLIVQKTTLLAIIGK